MLQRPGMAAAAAGPVTTQQVSIPADVSITSSVITSLSLSLYADFLLIY